MVVASIYWRVSADMIKDAILNVSWHCRAHTWSPHNLIVSSCAFNLHIQTRQGERESWRVFYHPQLKERNGSRSVVSRWITVSEFLFTFLSRCFFIQHITNSHLPHSRPAIKKYILANNKSTAATAAVFDSQFNKALRTGVEKGDFTQPKGTVYPPEPCFSHNIPTRCFRYTISSWGLLCML